ncbi:MAG: hypothetical protein IPK22_23285 [Verrucomicrobiaceae bacterium]|nr:hypothetical protein [Verrucomicrobiaceae bacterium]
MLPRTLVFTLIATSLLAAEPEKLTKLRGSYESAMTKATAPIQKTYTTELEKLKLEFTKSGKLEDALAVDAEIKRLSGETATKQAEQTPSSRGISPIGERWTRQTGVTYDFVPDGTLLTKGRDTPIEKAAKGTWKLLPDGRFELDYGTGAIRYFVITDRKVGTLIEPTGGEIKLTFDSKLK